MQYARLIYLVWSDKVDAMIFVRRFLTIPIAILVLVFLILAVVFLQISGSFLEPDYYLEEVREADLYRFALVDVATSALNEARELDSEDFTTQKLDENPLITIGLTTQQIVTSVNRAIPPEWIQTIIEDAFGEVGRYMTGEQDEFSVTLRAGDRVEPLVAEFKSLLLQADAYNLLFEELVDPAIEDAMDQELPLGLEVSPERLQQAVRTIVPAEWVQEQVEATLDELTPYATGERDTFEINIPVGELVEIALDEVKELLREVDAYSLLYDEVIEPELTKSIGDGFALPYDFTISADEVMSTLRLAAPPSWVQEQAEMVIDEAGPYLTGAQDEFSITISLADNKRIARDAIIELASEKLVAATSGRRTCSTEELARFARNLDMTVLRECSPPGIGSEQIINRVMEGLTDEVDFFVLGAIPDSIRFTEDSLRDALAQAGAEENLDLVDDVREIIRDGWTYTDQDLREDIRSTFDDPDEADDAIELFDDMRGFLADGWTYNTEDFRDHLAKLGDDEDGGQAFLDNFDDGRGYLDQVRRYKLVVYIPAILLLITIGFLGGRRWSSRFAWAFGALLVTGAIIFVAAGPVYSAIGEPRLDDAEEQAREEIDTTGDFKATQELVIDKSFDVMRSVVNGFASGLASKSLLLVIIGAIGMGVSLGWNRIEVQFRRISANRNTT